MYDIFVDNSDCRPTIVFMDFIRASILYGRECDDRLTLGPVIIASPYFYNSDNECICGLQRLW